MKLFVGIELGMIAKKELVSHYAIFRKYKNIRTIPDDNLHITLKFLGDVDDRKLPVVKSAVRDTFERNRQFDIGLKGVSAFPNINRAKVIWAVIEKNRDVLSNMHERLDSRLVSVGFEPEQKEFIPHITFARSAENVNIETITDSLNLRVESTVRSVALFESISTGSGVEYKKLYGKELI